MYAIYSYIMRVWQSGHSARLRRRNLRWRHSKTIRHLVSPRVVMQVRFLPFAWQRSQKVRYVVATHGKMVRYHPLPYMPKIVSYGTLRLSAIGQESKPGFEVLKPENRSPLRVCWFDSDLGRSGTYVSSRLSLLQGGGQGCESPSVHMKLKKPRDPVTGRMIHNVKNPLNKKDLTDIEMDEIFLDFDQWSNSSEVEQLPCKHQAGVQLPLRPFNIFIYNLCFIVLYPANFCATRNEGGVEETEWYI